MAAREPRDGCVVDTPVLATMLQDWVRRWNATRPPRGGQFTSKRLDDSLTMTATQWLTETTGLPEPTIAKVVNGNHATTELRIADPLVQAINEPEAFHDGRLVVRPNPLASREARASCCPGVGALGNPAGYRIGG